MQELKLDGFSVYFKTAEELDAFKKAQKQLKDDSMTAQELLETLEATKAELTEKEARIEELENSTISEEEKEAALKAVQEELEAEFLRKAELLAEAQAETGEKMDSLVTLSEKELLQKLTGAKDDGMTVEELRGYHAGMKYARKQNTTDVNRGTVKRSERHKQFYN